jgi:hypothetical protein
MSTNLVGKAVSNPSAEQKRAPFQGVDLAAAGRKGGKASGLSRRLRPVRELERGIVESRNGAAKVKLLAIKRREAAELLEEQRRLDLHTCRLLDERDDVLREIDQERGRRDRLRAEVDELEQRRAELQLDSDDAIIELLRSIGERRATEAALALGWDDGEENGEGGHVAR